MRKHATRLFLIALLCHCALAQTAPAHDGVNLEAPSSSAEAWNVIELCQTNIETLARERRWAEIAVQAGLTIEAAHYLRLALPDNPASAKLWGDLQELEDLQTLLIRFSKEGNAVQAIRTVKALPAAKASAESGFPPATVHARVYSCPMCKGVRELDAEKPCFKCGMRLVPRMIPASDLYNTPGEPSIALVPKLAAPLAVGRRSLVKIAFARKHDGAPVLREDLLIVHTEPIHLLIIDESLTDYHHEHPRPTGKSGEYEFSFTPARPGPYRVFADVVPRLSAVQEYATCNLSAAAPGETASRRADSSRADIEGLHFVLSWKTASLPLHARQPADASVTVTSADGQPFRGLEPVMAAFAHIVGFYGDHATVLHIHPTGPEPKAPQDRAGPEFSFRLYAPKPGFIRLFLQVQVAGRNVFAPLGVEVYP
jgi:hypothetical protein